MPSHVDWSRTLFVALIVLGLPGLFVTLLPLLVRPVVSFVIGMGYRIRGIGVESLPPAGAALLVVNHVTWLDGFFVLVACPRRIKALVNADYVNMPVVRWLARRTGIIPVPATGPRAQRAAISAAREALDAGELVVIFPEAQLTRNGRTGAFHRGLEAIVSGREWIPVIPVFLDNLWGSRFSFGRRQSTTATRRRGRRVVSVVFGPPVVPPATTFTARQAVIEAGVKAAESCGPYPEHAVPFDPALPHWRHPTLGLLTGSSPDVDSGGIRQTGQKPGTVGQALPHVAIRAVGEDGEPLGPDAIGQIEALFPGATWINAGCRGKVDREGFVTLTERATIDPSDAPSGELS